VDARSGFLRGGGSAWGTVCGAGTDWSCVCDANGVVERGGAAVGAGRSCVGGSFAVGGDWSCVGGDFGVDWIGSAAVGAGRSCVGGAFAVGRDWSCGCGAFGVDGIGGVVVGAGRLCVSVAFAVGGRVGGASSGTDDGCGDVRVVRTACMYDLAGGLTGGTVEGLVLDWRGMVMMGVVWLVFVLRGKLGQNGESWLNGDVLVAGLRMLSTD